MRYASLLLILWANTALAQCPFGAPPQPTITPEPGGWTVKPGNGVPMHWGDVPFPEPTAVAGSVVIQYLGDHNNPGQTCNWRTASAIVITLTSFSDVLGSDERVDSFEFPFNINQNQTWVIDLNNRWIKKVDLQARNAAGLSGPSNSSYTTAQHTGVRPQTETARIGGMLNWLACYRTLR